MPINHILMIDDDPDLTNLVHEIISKEQFRFSSANTSQKGLDRAKEALPNLIILDINLPGVGGMEVCRQLKNQPATKDIPILMLSVKSTQEDKIAGLELGADDYLTKPFHAGELLARINALLRRAGGFQASEEVLRSGDLCLNVTKHELCVDDQVVELRPKEYNLLYIFLTHKNRVLNRNYLVEAALSYEPLVQSRAIDVHIKNLRKKLGPYGNKIKTIREIGYKFEE